jgi:acyl carrier protein
MSDGQQFDKVYNRVRGVIAEVFRTEEEEISMETKFIDDLGAESLDIITLLMEFEDLFGKKIPDEDAEKLVTVGDAVKYIANLLEKPSQA